MCGRFSLSSIYGLQDRFGYENDIDLKERYNIAPSQQVPIVREDEGVRKASFYKWGLIPYWSKDTKIGFKMINARSETVNEKPSYKGPFKTQRCLILSDGFFEWQREGKEKKPYYFTLKDHQPFAFAGIWDRWEKDREVIYSCTLLTTSPNDLVRPIHDRMPVILTKEMESAWLDPHIQDTDFLKSLLVPYPEEDMMAAEVSTMVNSPHNDIPECIQVL